MEIDGKQLIDAPREQVWEALNNPSVLQACILGCEEINKLSDTEMKSVVVAKFGPIKARFKADISIEDVEENCSCKLVGKGQGGAAGFANGVADIVLSDEGKSTLLIYKVNFSVGGKLAQIGSRLIKGTTVKIVDNFFETLPSQL